MKNTRFLVSLGLSMFLMACSIAETASVANTEEQKQVETTRIFSKKLDDVWSATVAALSTSGYAIQNQDRSSGSVSTDFYVTKEAIGVFTTGNRHKLNVLVRSKSATTTEVTITTSFQIRVSDEANWSPHVRGKNQLSIERDLFDKIQANL